MVFRFFLLFFLFFCGVGSAQKNKALSPQEVKAKQQQLLELCNRNLSADFAGSVWVSWQGKTLLNQGFGTTQQGIRITSKTLIDVASVSKQFTGAGILKLEMLGKLKCSDSIALYLQNVPPDKKNITFHHLLTHTSGLPREAPFELEDLTDRVRFTQKLLSQPLQSKPGETFQYNNLAYCLLAVLIEVTAEEPFEKFMKQKLFQPAGMKDTGFVQDPQLDPKRALERIEPDQGGQVLGDALRAPWTWGFRGCTGVVSTVEDLAQWHETLKGNLLLSSKAKEKFYTPALAGYAYGWYVRGNPKNPEQVFHGGRCQGFQSQFSRYLQDDVCLVLLGNTHADFGSLETLLYQTLTSVTVKIEKLKSYEGRYSLPNGDQFEVLLLNDQLVLRSLGHQATSYLLHGQTRMPGWPLFYESIAKLTPNLLQPLLNHNLEQFREHFSIKAPSDNPEKALQLLTQHEQKWGKAQKIIVLGTRSAGEMWTWFQVVFPEKIICFKSQWDIRTFLSIEESAELFPFTLPLFPTQETAFKATSLDGQSSLQIRFEQTSNNSWSLIFIDAFPSEKKEITCISVR